MFAFKLSLFVNR